MNNTIIFQRMVPHYRQEIFDKIHRTTGAIFCLGRNGPKGLYLSLVEPEFFHAQIRDIYLSKKKDTLVFFNIFPPLIKYKPDCVVTEFALGIISNYLLLVLKPFLGYKLILWSHGYDRKKGFHPEKSFLDKLRLLWMNIADAVILYSKKDKISISKHVRNPEKLFVAQNTLNTEKLVNIRNQLEKIGKHNIKRQLGFKEKHNLIFIGRLLEDKEPDKLIEIFRIISRELNSVKLHIVGDGPLMNYLKSLSRGLNIKFWGNIIDDEKTGCLLFASDLTVIPGYIGLAAVHSFCFDTPVVTQTSINRGPYHSPEIEYVRDGETGFLVEYGENRKIAEVVLHYFKKSQLQVRIKKHIRNLIENNCSVNNMISNFKKALDYASRKRITRNS